MPRVARYLAPRPLPRGRPLPRAPPRAIPLPVRAGMPPRVEFEVVLCLAVVDVVLGVTVDPMVLRRGVALRLAKLVSPVARMVVSGSPALLVKMVVSSTPPPVWPTRWLF